MTSNRLLLPILFFFAGIFPLTGNTVDSLTIDNPGGFVIASDVDSMDPAYNRDRLNLSGDVTLSHPSPGTAGTYTYQFSWRVEDMDGVPHPLVRANGTIGASFTQPVSITFRSNQTSQTLSIDNPRLLPGSRLDPYRQYRVVLSITRSITVNGRPTTLNVASGESTAAVLYHFTSTDPGDAALNVIPTLLSNGDYSRNFLIDTIPGKNSAEARVQVSFLRYDNWVSGSANTLTGVTVFLDYVLRRASDGKEIPLETSRIQYNVFLANYSESGGIRSPFLLTPSFRTLSIRPRQGNHLRHDTEYFLEVTVSHREVAGTSPVDLTGNTRDLENRIFLHFNGQLVFGSGHGRINTSILDVSNSPFILSRTGSLVRSTLHLPPQSGVLQGKEIYTFGDTILDVDVDLNGNAVLRANPTSQLTLSPTGATSPDDTMEEYKDIRYQFLNGALSTSGLAGILGVYLPAGAGVQAGPERGSAVGQLLGVAPLGQALQPLDDVSLSYPGISTLWFTLEQMPLEFRTTGVLWEVGPGQIILSVDEVGYRQESSLAYLQEVRQAGKLVVPNASIKPSNAGYFRYANLSSASQDLVLRPIPTNKAGLSAALAFTPGVFLPHFPFGAVVSWQEGTLLLEDNKPVPEVSRLGGAQILQSYAQTCAGDACSTGTGSTILTMQPLEGELYIVASLGLQANGTLPGVGALAWGAGPGPTMTHSTDAFASASFHMPGIHIARDDLEEEIPARAVSSLLLAGLTEPFAGEREFPGTQAYLDGFGDYAGLNFRVTTMSFAGYSRLAGEEQPFLLSPRSKYYARFSGITGIHEAQTETFPDELSLYGYEFTFTNYGLSFLSNRNHDSRTNGSLKIPFPSDFTQPFDRLTFTCLGGLDQAQVPEDDTRKTLAYWLAEFDTLAISFERDPADPCNPGAGFLTLGLAHYPGTMPLDLFGRLAFVSNGNLLTGTAGIPGYDGRFPLPGNLIVNGPGDERYLANPLTGAYLNNFEERPASGSASISGDPASPESFLPGFLSFAASLGVPFFEALQIQVQTSASPSTTAPWYVIGGWPSHGWQVDGQHFFNNAYFDAGHRSYPNEPGITVDEYRNQVPVSHPEYLARARKRWLGVIDFDYPLLWSPINRTFRSPDNLISELLVVEIGHRVEYLSPDNAELVFGAEYTGLPMLSLSSVFFESIDGALGYAQTIAPAWLDNGFSQVDKGLNSLASLLNDRLRDFFSTVFSETIDAGIISLESEIRSRLEPFAPFPVAYELAVQQLVDDAEDLQAELLQILESMGQPFSNLPGVVNILRERVREARLAVALFRNQIVEVGLELEGSTILTEGLLYRSSDSDTRQFVKAMIEAIVGRELGGFFSEILDEPINAALAKADPALDQIDAILSEIEAVLLEIENEKLGPAGEFAEEIHSHFQSANAQLQNVVASTVEGYLLFLAELPSFNANFLEYSEEELRNLIRQRFEDSFYSSPLISTLQTSIQHRLFDVNAQIRAAMDSVFAHIRLAAQQTVAAMVGGVDQEILGFLGGVGDAIRHARLEGYAHINGDALRQLRLDGDFELQFSDTLAFNGFLQIQQLTSEMGPAGCGIGPGDTATEVSFGTINAPLSWISPGVRATITAKFSFEDLAGIPSVLGMGGGLTMTEGVIGFESFEINQLSAMLAVSRLASGHPDAPGVSEAYLSASLGMRFSSFEVSGGLFFGRTCSLDPISSWDPSAASILGSPPFTGAYVYGEGWIPILGVGCLFNVSIAAGAGIFYFQEGPTFGGKLMGGVSGEALCLVSVRGQIELIGVKAGDAFNFSGEGKVSGKLGACPLCLEIDKTVRATYVNDKWDIDI